MNDFYVYAWKINKTNHIFYVGKGTKYRYKSMKNRNSHFKSIINKYECSPIIIYDKLSEQEAWDIEKSLIAEYKSKNQCDANYNLGGEGGNVWTFKSDEELTLFKEKMKIINSSRPNRGAFKKGWYDAEVIARRAKTNSGINHPLSKQYELTDLDGNIYKFNTTREITTYLGISFPTFKKLLNGNASLNRNENLRKLKGIKIREV